MNYRGYEISQDNPYSMDFYAHDPDLDCDWDAEGYFQCSGMPMHEGRTLADVKYEIDLYFQELALDVLEELTGWLYELYNYDYYMAEPAV